MPRRLDHLVQSARDAADGAATRTAIGALQARLVRALPADAPLRTAEFQVFSQNGEDGIIQHLLNHVEIDEETFVEIGVSDYREANTRFLALHDNWRGLIVDAGREHVSYVQRTSLGWRRSITPVSARVTRENVNDLVSSFVVGDLGLLSLDIDGVDYWVLEALTAVSPRVLVVEYNAAFGPEPAITVPYRDDFDRTAAHWSNLYFGASLRAIVELAERKGHRFVGVDQCAVNAFFVRDDVAGALPTTNVTSAWREPRIRQARDEGGALTFAGDRAAIHAAGHLPVVDVSSNATVPLSEVLSP